MAKKQELFFVLGVAVPHERVARVGTFTDRDRYVIGVFETQEIAVNTITEGKWEFPYLAIESTRLGTQGERKLLRWYSTTDGKAESCETPTDMRGLRSLTY